MTTLTRRRGAAAAAALAAMLGAAACTPPVTVRAIASDDGQRDIVVMSGSAIGFMTRTGTITVRNADGSFVCKGGFAYRGVAKGDGDLSCNTGEKAEITFTAINSLSGYGEGETDQGRLIAFTYGLSKTKSDDYLAGTETGRAIGYRADGAVKKWASSGSGFFVSAEGHIVTNDHVAFRCETLEVVDASGARRPARIVAVKQRPDLALLKVDAAAPGTLALRAEDDGRLAEPVTIFGFPRGDELSSSGVLTSGSVASLTGLRDDPAYYGLAALALEGSSGGPAVSSDGALLGVVTAKLRDVEGLVFAVKSAEVSAFLTAQGAAHRTAAGPGAALPPVARAERMRRATVKVFCNAED